MQSVCLSCFRLAGAIRFWSVFLGLLWLGALATQATDRYVATGGSQTAPFTSWDTAATDLKMAVDWANTNDAMDTVWVSNGAYVLAATVCVTNTQIKGFSGQAADVVVNGNGAVRCFYLNHTNALLDGLTITNGYAGSSSPDAGRGGGVHVSAGTVRNCTLVGNTSGAPASAGYGGGLYANSTNAVVSNCVFNGNYGGDKSASTYGGGVYVNPGLVVECEIYSNNAFYGGGAYLASGGVVSNSMVKWNTAGSGGGGIYADSGTVDRCLISTNICTNGPGGGAYIANEGTMFLNSTCQWNRAYKSAGWAGGGGIYMFGGLVSNCLVISNTVYEQYYGGHGIFLAGTSTMANSWIMYNGGTNQYATYQDASVYNGKSGGGIYSVANMGYISGCTISSNMSYDSGGGLAKSGGSMVMRDSMVSRNISANGHGGGMSLQTYPGGYTVVSNCTIVSNTAYDAAGMYLLFSGGGGVTVLVDRCTVSDNSTWKYHGGGIYFNIGTNNPSSATARNCLIARNRAERGGGVMVSGGNTFFYNCTIASNLANTVGGISFEGDSTNMLLNSIIYKNLGTNGVSNDWSNASGVIWATNSCSLASLGAFGPGNKTNDPLFIDLAGKNYRLAVNSPCVNAGTNQDWMMNSFDLDGRTRIRYGIVDMGAYERVYDATVYRFR